MEHHGIPETLWTELSGRLWHVTSCNNFRRIIEDQEIRKIGTGQYAQASFCAKNGGVCLFDFGDAATYVQHSFQDAFSFFRNQTESDMLIWVEIDRNTILDNLWDAAKTRARWHEPELKYGKLLHGIEACHIGDIPTSSVLGFIFVARLDMTIFQKHPFQGLYPEKEVKEFRNSLPVHIEDALTRILLRHRGQANL